MKKKSKKQIRIEAISEGGKNPVERYLGWTFVRQGKNIVYVWDSSSNPKTRYAYKMKTEERESFIDRQKLVARQEADRKRRYEKEAEETKEKYVKGAIVYASWGYEQTNINFYKILRRTKSMVELVELAQEKTYDDVDRGKCKPSDLMIGEPFKARISKLGRINISTFRKAQPYEGGELSWTAYA